MYRLPDRLTASPSFPAPPGPDPGQARLPSDPVALTAPNQECWVKREGAARGPGGGGRSRRASQSSHPSLVGQLPAHQPGPALGGAAVHVLLRVPTADLLPPTCLAQVVQRIKAVEGQTRLLVVDKETDEELRRRQLTCTEEMAHRGLPPAHDPWEPKPDWARASSLGSEAGQKDVGGPPRELRPRLCHLRKGPQGYGFNLHSDKSRPGQYIRSVDPGSPAAHSGLRAQDRLIEVNGHNIEGLRHAEVVASIKAREDEARLLVVDPETDEYFKRLRVTPTEEHLEGPLPSPVTNGTSPVQLNGGSACSSRSDLPGLDKDTEDSSTWKRDPFQESGLHLSPTAAEAKEKARATRVNKRAPQMDWNRKREIFSNF
ncbi:Na(+)/H(+) exchange regulatory cofactor NHE-RF2 isoform X2 [Mustela putorius furo]|uniref:Na(+)/H(+) exchange regulatory cofactor NHE-RF2 isoform X2 n=1 Tax=Mustela putorius furo TaxID=9669 RepID=A0A8U0UV97_MUSPF|nr:Na(+)/H(+) exchange regulatory cofactor NHE-RF2 isoform X2 [Mustela putorius furo]